MLEKTLCEGRDGYRRGHFEGNLNNSLRKWMVVRLGKQQWQEVICNLNIFPWLS
jgi:hypothetical protein